ncbi:hypothetical protein BDF20DRAFT_101637 [Mycotypha africana]|uniref:uncharacterized protein n=1 Tax=Mycotypha africana TaxID=64632 RepID=UPI0023012327|nr:uncharacterized protein BDF20DRAFT_101637 [Mycotypha africana]KAI8970051.1 hypothetical protein BDF20DRAFT_101637 [Mycotypha africana]
MSFQLQRSHCLWINGCVEDTNYKFFSLFIFYVACYAVWVFISTAPLLLNIVRERAGGVTLQFCWKVYKIYLASIFFVWKNIYIMIKNRKWMSLFEGVPSLGLQLSFHWYSVLILGFLFGFLLTGFTMVHFMYIFKNLTSIEYIATKPLHLRVDFDNSGSNFEIVSVLGYNIYDQGFYKNWCAVMGLNPLFWFVPLRNSESRRGFDKLYPYSENFEKEVSRLARVQRHRRLQDCSPVKEN